MVLVVVVSERSGRLVAFIRWSRDAGWQDTLGVLTYPFKTWRCRLFGHLWGPEESDYDPNIGAKLQSSRSCLRPHCCGWWETFNYMAPGEQRVIG